MTSTAEPTQDRRQKGMLGAIERFGNALPDPVLIFVYLIAIVIALSLVGSLLGWQAVNPVSGSPVQVQSLFTPTTIQTLIEDMPKTLTNFAPLGMVLVVMLGAGVAERSGYFSALMRAGVKDAPKRLLTPIVFFMAMMANQAADAAYVVLIPLAGALYAAAGRHPILGIAVAFAGVSGGFSANLLPGQLDALLLGLTQTSVGVIDPSYSVNIAGNWFFIAGMTMVFLPIGWFVADAIIEPRLGQWQAGAGSPIDVSAGELSPQEKRGLGFAALAALAVVGLWVALTIMPNAPLVNHNAVKRIEALKVERTALDTVDAVQFEAQAEAAAQKLKADAATGLGVLQSQLGLMARADSIAPGAAVARFRAALASADARLAEIAKLNPDEFLARSKARISSEIEERQGQVLQPFYHSLIAGFFLLFLGAGIAFGMAVGTIKTHRDTVRMMGEAMADLGPYILLAFVAAHFILIFNATNLGAVSAIQGATGIQNAFGVTQGAQMQPWQLAAVLALLVVLASAVNLAVGSASAKWGFLGPIFVPMLMLVGVSPEMTTAAYRVGDSVTNIITPLMVYFPLVLTFCQRWDAKFGMGSLMACMIPFSVWFLVGGVALTVGWVMLSVPLGPGVGVDYGVALAKP